jgi:hypothetical protein
MTIAEIRGKISRTGENLSERLEDLLTSDTFTACRYVKPETLLMPFLKQAVKLDDEPLGEILRDGVDKASYLFWPRLERSEPDVLMLLEFSSGHFFIIIIEAKYFSPKSSSALSEEELEIAETASDQLAREYLDLLNAHKAFNCPRSMILGRALIYITAHRLIPRDSLSESATEIKKFVNKKGDINLYWTNWFELHPIITEAKNALGWERPVLNDLQQLLERKRLVHFRGFSLDAVLSIQDGSIYKVKVKKRPTDYRYILLPETIMPLPIIYSSGPKLHEYNWSISEKKNIGKIYKGG